MLLFLFQSKFFLSNFMCLMHWGRRMIIVLLFLMLPWYCCIWCCSFFRNVFTLIYSFCVSPCLDTSVTTYLWRSQSNLGELLLSFHSVVLGMELRLSDLAVSALLSVLSHLPVLSSSLHSVLSSVGIFLMQDKWVLEMLLQHLCSLLAILPSLLEDFSKWGSESQFSC